MSNMRSFYLTILSMFGRTGALTQRCSHSPENVGQQHSIFWPIILCPLRSFVWRAATFKFFLGAGNVTFAGLRDAFKLRVIS